jgi:hypothetical protein
LACSLILELTTTLPSTMLEFKSTLNSTVFPESFCVKLDFRDKFSPIQIIYVKFNALQALPHHMPGILQDPNTPELNGVIYLFITSPLYSA